MNTYIPKTAAMREYRVVKPARQTGSNEGPAIATYRGAFAVDSLQIQRWPMVDTIIDCGEWRTRTAFCLT
jgi:hypothetical protein